MFMPWDHDGDMVVGLKGSMDSQDVLNARRVIRVPKAYLAEDHRFTSRAKVTCHVSPEGKALSSIPGCGATSMRRSAHGHKTMPSFCLEPMSALECIYKEIETDFTKLGFQISLHDTKMVLHDGVLAVDIKLYAHWIAKYYFPGNAAAAAKNVLPTALLHMPSLSAAPGSPGMRPVRVPRYPGALMVMRKNPSIFRNPCPCKVDVEAGDKEVAAELGVLPQIPGLGLTSGVPVEDEDRRAIVSDSMRVQCQIHFNRLEAAHRQVTNDLEQGSHSRKLSPYKGVFDSRVCKFCHDDPVENEGSMFTSEDWGISKHSRGLTLGYLRPFFPSLEKQIAAACESARKMNPPPTNETHTICNL
jgi:hypothetical protein